MFGWNKKIPASEIKNYEKCFLILEELKECPTLQETLFKKREEYMKKVFLLEGEKKLQMEGRIMELNDILETKKNMAHHINTFRAVAREQELDIDSELEEYQLNR